MNGCLNKSLTEMKSLSKLLTAFVLILGIICVFAQNDMIFSFYITFIAISSASQVLEGNGTSWQTYEYMLPTSCEQSVSAVYIVSVIYNGIFFLGTLITHIAGGLICKAADGALDLPKPEDVTIMDGEFIKMLLFFSFFSLFMSGLSCAYFYRYRHISNRKVYIGAGLILLVSVAVSGIIIGSEIVTLSWGIVIPTIIISLIVFPLSEKFSEFFYDKYRG